MTNQTTYGGPAGFPLIGIALFLFCLFAPADSPGQAPDFRKALGVAGSQARRTIAELGDPFGIPRYTRPDGRWQTSSASEWTSGFFPGMLWYLSEQTGDSLLTAAARRWTAAVEGQKLNSRTHDLGFMINCSFGNGFRITGDPHYKEVLLQAARTLAGRYNPKVGCIKSWDWPKQWAFPVIVDNMMNLELLMWASRNGGGDTLAAIARSHALRTIQNHFRPDGSTFHVVDYDPLTGVVVTRQTHQGAADSSVWARGQAWAIYGFTMMYRETRDPRFLGAARRAAGFFLDHLPPDGVPYWDFDAPRIPDEPRDASAAAIAASGLIELARYCPPSGEGHRYLQAATEILRTLCSPEYLADPSSSFGILKHAVGNRPANNEVDVSLVYGDYYFVESLIRAMDLH
jgi:unsaturated chondroitin disaccharide hydrolase